MTGYRSRQINASGKRSLVFNKSKGFADRPVKIPCGQCIGCRLERSRQWAMRCVHESKLYSDNCFITLTYDDRNLPKHGSLVKDHLQKFMKRLRFRYGNGIRFFACGEYGEKFGRPHYHVCIFNFDFDDRKLLKEHNGQRYFTSESLSTLWPYGHCVVGDVSFESAAYVARYITKKVTGVLANNHYGPCVPEFTVMSRRPGIGTDFLNKYSKQIYSADFVVLRGMKMKPPKFYDGKFELTYSSDFQIIKARRKRKGYQNRSDSTQDRLLTKETVAKARLSQLKRSFEDG